MGQVVPLRAANWDFMPGVAEFADGASGPVMKIVARGYVVLKNTDFADGTIEFDDQPVDERFASFFFHWQDSVPVRVETPAMVRRKACRQARSQLSQ